jgi:hypothetical protein
VLIVLLAMGWRWLSRKGTTSAEVERVLTRIPLVGRVRQHWALARFAQVFHACLMAGMNMSECMRLAGMASHSGVLKCASEDAASRIATGETVSGAMADVHGFPLVFVHSVATAELAGTLDREMNSWAASEMIEAQDSLKTATDWMPKIFYAVVACYVAYRIVTTFTAAALLVLLAAAAGARVVAADVGGFGLGLVRGAGDDEARTISAVDWARPPPHLSSSICSRRCCGAAGSALLGGKLGEELLKRGELLRAAEEIAEHLAVDVVHQLREDREGFLLELDERVFLAVGAQADAFLQGIERIQVLLPQAVDGVEEDHLLDLLQGGRVGVADLHLVGAENLFLQPRRTWRRSRAP